VERVENQTQVFHSSHRPLEISPTPRDFHIPTAQAGRAWKSGKPKSGFPLSHTRPATMTTVHFKKSKSKANLAASGGKKNNPKKESHHAAECRLRALDFQAHPALESRLVLRLIPRWNQTSISGSLSDWKMLFLIDAMPD
jgi:hypothetical protein